VSLHVLSATSEELVAQYSLAGKPIPHARRKFFDLHATNKSQIAEKALHYIAALYEVEREVRELEPGVRQRIRQEKAAPIIDAFHTWMIAQRQLVPEGSAIAKALDSQLGNMAPVSRRHRMCHYSQALICVQTA